jgi:hypothetical protein
MSEEPNEQKAIELHAREIRVEDMMKMGSGRELDMIFAIDALKRANRKTPKHYSENLGLALEAVVAETDIPIGFGRSAIGDPYYNPERPYWAGNPAYAIVTANAPALAVCKAAILMVSLIDAQKASLFGKKRPGLESMAVQGGEESSVPDDAASAQ